ncbi:MAG: hypothetical protein IJV27_09350 [Prevotella sp.]|nr:hypothetical protein [Prevotella sp.]
MTLVLFLCACSSIDCPLNNTVYMRIALKGDVDTLKDTLTISTVRTDGADTILFNQGVNLTYVTVPMSYAQDEDALIFQISDTTGVTKRDTLWIAKQNQSHFESVDCSPSYFHTITAVSHSRNNIDSVTINEPNVDYDATKEHLYLYLHPRN